jgi:Fe-S cluster assembly iron-binding protein IscA
MFVAGTYSREIVEDSGRFDCPNCQQDRDFRLIRTWEYAHIYIVISFKQRLLAEHVVCGDCQRRFPITVLARRAQDGQLIQPIESQMPASILDQFAKVVDFTDAAVVEIKGRFAAGGFRDQVVVRVECEPRDDQKVTILFDYPIADDRDWLGESNGLPIVVSRDIAPKLQGATIDFVAGKFVRISPPADKASA